MNVRHDKIGPTTPSWPTYPPTPPPAPPPSFSRRPAQAVAAEKRPEQRSHDLQFWPAAIVDGPPGRA